MNKTFAGKYAVHRVLGQGGMGTVFEAQHIRLGHRVAIKVLAAALLDVPQLVQRFDREARAAGSLTSPHAVRIFDIDATDDGVPYMVMERLDGQDLAQIIEAEGPQPIGRAARWIIQACDAIAEAHRLGIVHRDIKPNNLFLCAEGTVKVLDFGIAKVIPSRKDAAALTEAVQPMGTPQYMSPEQVRCARDVDGRTDIWSLGITLYELLTGRTPFATCEASACIAAIAADPIPDPRTFNIAIPDDLARVVMKALEKKADHRPQTATELAELLMPFSDQRISLPQFVPPPPRATETDFNLSRASSARASQVRSRKMPLLAMASGVVFAVGFSFFGLRSNAPAPLHGETQITAAIVAPPTEVQAPPIPTVITTIELPDEEPPPVIAAAVQPTPLPTPRASASAAKPRVAVTPSKRGGSVVAHGGLSSPGF